MDPTQLRFNLSDSEELGKAIIKLKELTGYSASHCADMIHTQNTDAKILLFGNSDERRNGVAPATH